MTNLVCHPLFGPSPEIFNDFNTTIRIMTGDTPIYKLYLLYIQGGSSRKNKRAKFEKCVTPSSVAFQWVRGDGVTHLCHP